MPSWVADSGLKVGVAYELPDDVDEADEAAGALDGALRGRLHVRGHALAGLPGHESEGGQARSSMITWTGRPPANGSAAWRTSAAIVPTGVP